ncbi:MAG: alkaline phosphatase family protein [Thermoproteota archaeon]
MPPASWEVEGLRLREIAQGLFVPGYDGYSLHNLSNSIMRLIGVRQAGKGLREKFLSGFRGFEKIILLVIDAMGLNVFTNSSSKLRILLNKLFMKEEVCFKALTSVFPSTTSTALTSLNTGLTPQEHGIVAYTMFLKELGSMVNMISLSPVNDERKNRIFNLGFSPEKLLNARVLTERLKEEGFNPKTILRYGIRNSGLSTILYKGSRIVPALSTVDFTMNIARLVEDKGSDFIIAYWDGFDGQSHYYGPFSQEAQLELLNTFTLLRDALSSVAGEKARKTLFIMTADHGQSGVREDKSFIVEKMSWLNESLVMPPAGESRAAYLYVKDRTEGFNRAFSKKLGGEIALFESRELLRRGVFGTGRVNGRVLDRIGNYVALSYGEGRLVFQYDLRERAEPEFVRAGAHGSLTRNELLVPLVVCGLSELSKS